MKNRSERGKNESGANSYWYVRKQGEVPAKSLVMFKFALLKGRTQSSLHNGVPAGVWLTHVLVLYWGRASCILLRRVCREVSQLVSGAGSSV